MDEMTTEPSERERIDARRYFEAGAQAKGGIAAKPPVCLYLEVTNRCNLLCTTCPRTYVELEPPADMSWQLFTRIVDQVPKDRGVYVLFNTNGTVLNEKNGRALIDAGLDELRVSLDASTPESYIKVRGKDYFRRILKNIKAFRALQEREGHATPRVSAWLTGLKETIEELPGFVRLAAEIGVKEVYLQRLVFFDHETVGLARPDQALFEQMETKEASYIDEASALAKSLGLTFSASGAACEPGLSLAKKRSDSPWSLCRRPWTVMYFTANGRALPCCIAPFSQHGYENYTLGDATQETLREIWNGERYKTFREGLSSDKPPQACANCGLRWSL